MHKYDIPEKPFLLSGLVTSSQGKFWRLPEEIIDKVNPGVAYHARQTAGACVRFSTDSAVIGVSVKLIEHVVWSNMTLIGMAGCDVYIDGIYAAVICMTEFDKLEYYGEARPKTGGRHEVRINLPIFAALDSISILLEDGAEVSAPAPYKYSKPVVFYGSSITNGASASHAGNAYTTMLSMRMGFELYSLGFSGSACGEKVIADYIASLDMTAFVLDYDHNAPNAAHLEATHEALFKAVRAKHPELPVVMLSKPDFDSDPASNAARRDIVRRTYEHAIADGDKNVRFADGEKLFGCDEAREHCTADGCHPNDLGFCRMADTVEPLLKEMLSGKK
jgi:hypothetical protein